MDGKWILTARQRCDLEMLLVGGFRPLSGFLTREDCESVLTHHRLTTGELWPIPIALDVSDRFAETVEQGQTIGLYDADNTLIARMTVKDKWKADKKTEAQTLFHTMDTTHPGVNYLFHEAGSWYLGGPIQLVNTIKHFDFPHLRHTPASLKQLFAERNWKKIVGFQTRNPLHRAHMELTLRASKEIGGHVLIHPVVGLTQPGDIDYFTRVRCYQKILPYYPVNAALLSLLPLAMRMAGPREALWHALIRKNYGCTHFIIGRDHAGPGLDSKGNPFYDPYAAQDFVREHEKEMGIAVLPFEEMVYVKERNAFCARGVALHSNEIPLTVSGTALRKALLEEKPIPEWFSFPAVIEELRHAYLPKYKKGFTLFLTGLSGAGKTVLSQALFAQLKKEGLKNVTVLDSDITRRILSNELGYSKSDRDLNIRRMGFVASEITKVGGIAICAAIAPYENARHVNRQLISQYGGYVEIYLTTSFNECAKRDTKGLYAKAMKGELPQFTGYNDPYEPPLHPELSIDTSAVSIENSVEQIMAFLINQGYVKRTEAFISKKEDASSHAFRVEREEEVTA